MLCAFVAITCIVIVSTGTLTNHIIIYTYAYCHAHLMEFKGIFLYFHHS